jgi:hypothetical protein
VSHDTAAGRKGEGTFVGLTFHAVTIRHLLSTFSLMITHTLLLSPPPTPPLFLLRNNFILSYPANWWPLTREHTIRRWCGKDPREWHSEALACDWSWGVEWSPLGYLLLVSLSDFLAMYFKEKAQIRAPKSSNYNFPNLIFNFMCILSLSPKSSGSNVVCNWVFGAPWPTPPRKWFITSGSVIIYIYI